MDPLIYRAIIFHLFTQGKTLQQIHGELQATYGEKAPSYSTVARWVNEFRRGRQDIDNKTSPGRPNELATESKLAQAVALVKKNPDITTSQLALLLHMSQAGAKKIMQVHLGYKNSNGKWVANEEKAA